MGSNKPKPLQWIKDGECIRCTSHASLRGYPIILRRGRRMFISRHILLRRLGDSLSVTTVCRHSCDNAWCINPSHITHGIQADNMRDMVERNRSAKGEHHSQAKLTTDQVLHIKRLLVLGVFHKTIAKIFGVRRENISKINQGKTWAHVLTSQDK